MNQLQQTCNSIFLLGRALTIISFVGSAQSATTLDSQKVRAQKDLGGESSEFNYVAQIPTFFGRRMVTGGVIGGAKVYAPSDWSEVVSAEFDGNSVVLLTSMDEAKTLKRLLEDGNSEPSTRLRDVFASYFQTMKDIAGADSPKVNIRYRLVPPGYAFKYEVTNKISDYKKFPLDLLAVLPRQNESLGKWLDSVAKNSVHEFSHMTRWNTALYPKEISSEANEVFAYFAEFCSSLIARNHLPDSVFSFPLSLEETVDGNRKISVSRLYNGLVGLKEQPTIVGFNTFALAFHRYFSDLKASGVQKPAAKQALPLCTAVAHDELEWGNENIDSLIATIALQEAKKVNGSRDNALEKTSGSDVEKSSSP